MRRWKTLWKRFLAWIGAALLAPCLLACQPTPEKPVVIQKDMEQMLETALGGTDAPASDAPADAVDLYARLGAPARYTAELQSNSGRLRVYVDADVLLPACELPIVRVQKRAFTTDEVRRYAAVLFGDNAHYIEYTSGMFTAAYCREIAEQMRAAIEDWDGRGHVRYGMQYKTPEQLTPVMNEWLAKAAAAPETLPAVEPDFTWRYSEVETSEGVVKDKQTNIVLYAMPDEATFSIMHVTNGLRLSGGVSMDYVRDTGKAVTNRSDDNKDVSAFVHITMDEGYEIARQTVAELGGGDFICVHRQGYMDSYKEWGAYTYVFVRRVLGVPETYTNAQNAYDDSYARFWGYERIHVHVDDAGVLQLWYDAPSALLDTVTGAAALMPFAEIQSVFEKMVLIVNNRTDEPYAVEINRMTEYHVTSVRLGLMSIVEANGADTGLLIPVWDFLGYESSSTDAESRVYTSYTNEQRAFLTINAIDGTIIDRQKGY